MNNAAINACSLKLGVEFTMLVDESAGIMPYARTDATFAFCDVSCGVIAEPSAVVPLSSDVGNLLCADTTKQALVPAVSKALIVCELLKLSSRLVLRW